MPAPSALILAPLGRDAEIAAGLLEHADIPAAICPDVAALEAAVGDDALFAIVTDEALRSAALKGLSAALDRQAAWSDLPFVVLTKRGGGVERNPVAARLSNILRNVTFLERPFHPTTFVSVARTALRSRRRQFEARARMEELAVLTATLEERVAARTAELEGAHATVLQEIGQRQRAEEQLRQAQKMEMIGQLTGGVAHDFNNLLMAVIGNLDILRRRAAGDDRSARLIDGALQGARRGAALTQRLLAFARRQELTIGPVDLVELVRGMTALMERSLAGDIELRVELAEGLPPALMDANQVELALLNLVVNARDAMDGGGVVTVRVDAAAPDAGTDLPPGDYVRLAVEDTGAGMDAPTLARATEPFFSTKELGKGTGLGLSMIQGLAAQLGGALRLTSVPGEGTRAELWLPATAAVAAETPAAEPAEAPACEPEAPALRAKILAVDDDALIAMSTIDMLEDLGHEVFEANSGPEALELLRSEQPLDLMITDYAMPRMNGAQLAEAARALRPDLPILIASGYVDLPAGSGGLDLPRISKPYDEAQLATEIGKLLKR